MAQADSHLKRTAATSALARSCTVHFEARQTKSGASRPASALALSKVPKSRSVESAAVQPNRTLTQRDVCAETQSATRSNYEELVAEADALLLKLKRAQPAEALELVDPAIALAAKRQQAAARTRLAIVRVRVSLSPSQADLKCIVPVCPGIQFSNYIATACRKSTLHLFDSHKFIFPVLDVN